MPRTNTGELTQHFMESEDPALRCAYWKGYLSATIATAIDNLDRRYGDEGTHLYSREAVSAMMRDTLEMFCAAPGNEQQAEMLNRLPAGFAVIAANGEPQAVRDTWEEAVDAESDVQAYWIEAETCGHPAAPKHVAALRPFSIVQVSRETRAEYDEAGPTIDREP